MQREFYISSILNEAVAKSEAMAQAVTAAAQRFNNRDWGKVPDEDKALNNADLEARSGHVLGRYDSPEGDLYINMEFHPDREIAVIMFRSEY